MPDRLLRCTPAGLPMPPVTIVAAKGKSIFMLRFHGQTRALRARTVEQVSSRSVERNTDQAATRALLRACPAIQHGPADATRRAGMAYFPKSRAGARRSQGRCQTRTVRLVAPIRSTQNATMRRPYSRVAGSNGNIRSQSFLMLTTSQSRCGASSRPRRSRPIGDSRSYAASRIASS